MSKIGYGYGSEWHLMRYLAYHRNFLKKTIIDKTGIRHFEFVDHRFSQSPKILEDDIELAGIDFIDEEDILVKWDDYWPHTGSPPKWDAIGIGKKESQKCYLLFEAKANTDEIKSECKAVSKESICIIEKALCDTKNDLGIKTDNDWKKCYYQMANRISVLNFLNKNDVVSIMINIYFTGEREDMFGPNQCSRSESQWNEHLKIAKNYLGFSELENYFDIFLSINENDKSV